MAIFYLVMMFQVAETVINENRTAYPELVENQEYIVKVIKAEEERFAKTINAGTEMLMSLIETGEGRQLSGEDAFKLYDTFGFPVDLTNEILAERNIAIDEEGFTKLMEEQRVRARTSRKDVSGWNTDAVDISHVAATAFTGYSQTQGEGMIEAIISGGEVVETIEDGDQATIVLNTTPFYGESGGQVGDTGLLCDLGERLLIAQNMLRRGEHVFLDDVSLEEVSQTLGVPVIPVPQDGFALFDAIFQL